MATTAISLEEYLKTVPDPDVEYVDGELKERRMAGSIHGLLQFELCLWFGTHRKAWKLLSAVEVRTRVSETRAFLPDVIIARAYEWPPVLTEPPMIVIEILSPGDSFMELEQKCDTCSAMGIKNVWVINPQRRTGRLWREGAWMETTRFSVDGSEIYLDLKWLFAEIDSYKNLAV